MKKLLLLLAITSISFGSMAMGFPQNTYEQQRTLSKNIKQKNLVNELEKSIKVNLESITSVKEDTNVQSFVEMLTNYVVEFFSERLFGKSVAKCEILKETKNECLAIKQEFEYYFVA
ncbi:hypothetical protein [Emticicia sp. W12TSBA100-4]|uniref:hypothetical protein n=1 Tax=Emticicia sp. W12TSBA100-4 TaxID=3160965 RepID=UPI00330670A9